MLLATLPTPQIGNTVNISVASRRRGTNQQNEGTPTIVIDPNNSQKMVAVYQISNSTINIGDGQTPITTYIGAASSVDGGRLGGPLNIGNQTYIDITRDQNGGPFFTQDTDPSVAFDGQDNVYVLFSTHNPSYNAGYLNLSKFDFTGTSPILTAQPKQVYSYYLADPAFTPTLAVNTNPPEPDAVPQWAGRDRHRPQRGRWSSPPR